MGETVELLIDRLGAQGDGVADHAGQPVFVPFTLPGERVRASIEGERGKALEILAASEARVVPVCPHFGVCGGCALQHLEREPYLAFKSRQIAAAFGQRGLDIGDVEVLAPAGKRRRAVLSAERAKGRVVLGFHAAQSRALIDVEACAVLEGTIVAALPGLRRLLDMLMAGDEARITVTATRAGLDVHIDGACRALSAALRADIARHASACSYARVTIGRDVVFEALRPFLRFGAVDVFVPPGVFVQAVAAAEAAMANLAVAGVGKATSIADLFCGAGAFTFALAASAKVSAFDSDRTAIDALNAAVRTARGVKPITGRVRDLFREPLSPMELNDYDAVVFDPPRAGAEAQARNLVRSKVKTVVAVSCKPATLARDARILIDGGFKLDRVVGIDQFHFSPHVEAVALFKRAAVPGQPASKRST